MVLTRKGTQGPNKKGTAFQTAEKFGISDEKRSWKKFISLYR